MTTDPTGYLLPLKQFSDDEGEADQPLAPIQPEDLVEVVEGDDDDQDEAAGSNAAEMTPAPISRDVSEPAPSRPPGKDEDDGQSKPTRVRKVTFRLTWCTWSPLK